MSKIILPSSLNKNTLLTKTRHRKYIIMFITGHNKKWRMILTNSNKRWDWFLSAIFVTNNLFIRLFYSLLKNLISLLYMASDTTQLRQAITGLDGESFFHFYTIQDKYSRIITYVSYSPHESIDIWTVLRVILYAHTFVHHHNTIAYSIRLGWNGHCTSFVVFVIFLLRKLYQNITFNWCDALNYKTF